MDSLCLTVSHVSKFLNSNKSELAGETTVLNSRDHTIEGTVNINRESKKYSIPDHTMRTLN